MAYCNPQQGQPQVPYPAPIVYFATPAVTYQQAVTKNYVPYFSRQTSTILGAFQVVLACMSIAAGTIAIVYGAECWYTGVGIWCGVMYLIAGAIAIAAGDKPTNSLIKATEVWSALDIVFGVTQVIIASIGVGYDISCYHNNYCDTWIEEVMAANSLNIVVGSLEIIFGIWLLVVSCRAIRKGSNAQTAITPVNNAAAQPQVVFIQAPSLQPQPLQIYNGQLQYPSMPNSQQVIYISGQQAPAFQPQPLQTYNSQLQYPSMPNAQQVMYISGQQDPSVITKPEDEPPPY